MRMGGSTRCSRTGAISLLPAFAGSRRARFRSWLCVDWCADRAAGCAAADRGARAGDRRRTHIGTVVLPGRRSQDFTSMPASTNALSGAIAQRVAKGEPADLGADPARLAERDALDSGRETSAPAARADAVYLDTSCSRWRNLSARRWRLFRSWLSRVNTPASLPPAGAIFPRRTIAHYN